MHPDHLLLLNLETQLLTPQTRRDTNILNGLIAEDFEELSSDGRVISRHEVIDWLTKGESDVLWTITNFRTRPLSGDIAVATYVAVKIQTNAAPRRSMRSSIWRRLGDRWQMVFHQGTRLGD